MPSRLHLLLVDDNIEDVLLAREALEVYQDKVRLSVCHSGQEALACIHDPRESSPDLVVLDINMPHMGGFEVLAAIRAHPSLSYLPVIMLSGSNSPLDVDRAYALRASCCLVKALEFPTLLRQMEALVQFWTLCKVPVRFGAASHPEDRTT